VKSSQSYVLLAFSVTVAVALLVNSVFVWTVDIGTPWKWLISTVSVIGAIPLIMSARSAALGLTDATHSSTDTESHSKNPAQPNS
jgi:hypothetical protein